MGTKKAINEKIYEELKKSVHLRKYSSDDRLSFDKTSQIQKEQREAYNKFNFFKNLKKAMNEGEK